MSWMLSWVDPALGGDSQLHVSSGDTYVLARAKYNPTDSVVTARLNPKHARLVAAMLEHHADLVDERMAREEEK